MTYRLTLTEQDVATGEHILPEHVAWRLVDAFDADTEGGHSHFPMLNPRSALADKLAKLIEEIT